MGMGMIWLKHVHVVYMYFSIDVVCHIAEHHVCWKPNTM